MYIYQQNSGVLSFNGEIIAKGYSGFGEGKNNPAMEKIADIGPIPRGVYNIGPSYDDKEKGPCVMRLTPSLWTDPHGRSGFMIHGDSIIHPGMASHGCIILMHDVRIEISEGTDKIIEVV